MILIEQVRKEIERLNNPNKQIAKEQGSTDFIKGITAGYAEILSFLDTLENATEANEVLMGRVKAPSLDMESIRRRLDTLQEPEVDLEEEVKRYWNNHSLEYRLGRIADIDFLYLCARHFYELGKNSK